MDNRSWTTNLPPEWSPGLGRNHYLPEDYYIAGYYSGQPRAVPVDVLARLTAKHVSRWADRFEAYRLILRSEARNGPLPAEPQTREELIDELFDWFTNILREDLSMVALNLYIGDQRLLYQHDGIPGVLALTPDEFAELQDVWQRHGLPRDLYYDARQQREVVEPWGRSDRAVLARRRYSPVRWAHRDHVGIEALRVPNEEERIAAFNKACQEFSRAVVQRIRELQEPGRKGETRKIRQLQRLLAELGRAHPREGHLGPLSGHQDDQPGESQKR